MPNIVYFCSFFFYRLHERVICFLQPYKKLKFGFINLWLSFVSFFIVCKVFIFMRGERFRNFCDLPKVPQPVDKWQNWDLSQVPDIGPLQEVSGARAALGASASGEWPPSLRTLIFYNQT